MDDLDHSMHISDHDWLSFFQESEECSLLQPSLACPDSCALSEGEDLDFTTHTYIPGEESKEPQVVEEEVSSVVCSADEGGKVGCYSKAEPELPVTEGVLRCTGKERWFVTVNDPPQHREPAVGKKKRRQQKIWKDKHQDGKDLFSDTKSESLETEANKTCLEVSCKGDSLHHVGNTGTNQRKHFKSSQLISPGTETIEEVSRDCHSTEQSMDLACHEASFKDNTLNFANKPTKMKQETDVDLTQCTETLNTVFIQEKDPDFECGSSQTKLTMDLSGLEDFSVEDNLHTNKSTTRFELDRTNQDLKIELTCLANSGEDKVQQSAIDCTKTGTTLERDITNDNTDLGPIHSKCLEICHESSKQEDFRYIGASCKVGSLDLACGNHAESAVNTGKPIDNPVSHTNESDDFADVEFVSSSSYDSETYHSAAESMEDPWHLSIQNSPCNLSISINGDSLADRGMSSCLQPDGSRPHIETSQIFPSAHLSADNMPNDSSACTDGTKSTALDMSVDTPTSAGKSSSSSGGQPESFLQLDVTMESPEAYAKATGNSQPVYAISAFWDEMEKLTINDILHIRMGRCMLPIEEALSTDELVSSSCDIKTPSTIIPESAITDTMDAADSDYYTNLDESKPDRSSCEFSTSDFEEEYWQFLNSSRNSSPDLHDKSYESQCTDYVSTGEDASDEIGTPVPEDCSEQKWSCESTFGSNGVAVPQQMRKTKSMYDVHALKAMEDLSAQAYFDQSGCKSLEVSLNVSDGFEVVTPVMSHAEEQYQVSFPKVFEYLFDDNKTKCEAMSVSVYGLQENPALRMNDYTFCTTLNDLPLRHYSEEPIPIFSCSRPSVRELTFPKPGCIFLGTNYSAMKDASPIQMISQSIIKSMDCKQTERAFCLSQDLSNLYSVKSVCFLDKGTDVWRYQSEDEGKPVDAIDSSITVDGEGGVLSMTPQMFKETAFRQISMENNQIPSDYQTIFSTIKQSDMCLVCIAFASWVLRSTDPEAADAWKAALLANVSALSAIQYLRQYMKKKASPQDDG